MIIRAETQADAAAIRAVNVAAFGGPLEAELVDRLRAAGRLTISLVAEAHAGETIAVETIVGHIAFSPVTATDGSRGFGLAPLAVRPERQRRGIGSSLVMRGLRLCRERTEGYVVVLGEPAYYGRFGFAAASAFGLNDEYGGGDAFQVLELQPGGIPQGAGVVRYSPEFALFGV